MYRRRLGLLSPGLGGVSRRPPALRAERLLLRGYEPSDAPGIFAYCSDPETTQYMFFDAHRSIGDAHDFLNNWVADAYRKGELKYAVCLADEPERIIGGIDLRVDPNQHRTMELGYILAREHWGRGYMPEAARKLIEHAFATTDVQRIEAPIFAQNTRSRRAAEKMGLSLDGVLRSSRAARGQCWDVAITRSYATTSWAGAARACISEELDSWLRVEAADRRASSAQCERAAVREVRRAGRLSTSVSSHSRFRWRTLPARAVVARTPCGRAARGSC